MTLLSVLLRACEPAALRVCRFGACVALLVGCSSGGGGDAPKKAVLTESTCQVASGVAADYVRSIGCRADFQALASVPVDANIPGARSTKVVLDQLDGDALYFQNSQTYKIHYQFASKFLSGNGRPVVPELSAFNQSEYYSSDRRFILAAVTYYEDPDAWTLELAPYDTASSEMIAKIMAAVKASAYFGPALAFHPTSDTLAAQAQKLGTGISLMTTEQIYAGTTYQPLTLATAVGQLHFMKAADLANTYVPYRDIVVLDEVPNDISVVMGIITEQFQTPLSHINVLSNNRGTPNMSLRNATTNATLKALEGKWVELTVDATAWSIREVTSAEADTWWEAHKPTPVVLPALDVSATGLPNIETLVDLTAPNLRDAIKKAVLAYGGKSAHYSVLARTANVPIKKAFAIPVSYYDQFMRQNGFYDRIAALLADASFKNSADVRDLELAKLRADMMKAPVDQEFQTLLKQKLAADYPGLVMRFRTSTNSEDLDGFPCAGCYESHTGDPANWDDVLNAIRETWSTVWLFRTFEERSYYGIDHTSVGMALLVHHHFAAEEANGVAVTANPYDESGLEPGFYINVQWGGDAEVVHPPPGVSSDEFLYFFNSPNRPTTYLTHSNLVPAGETVLTARQTYQLGSALSAIHDAFSAAYGPKSGNNGWYAMDIEFKFDDEAIPGQPAELYVKQARPYPGRGTVEETD